MKHSPAREALSCTNLLSNRSAGLRRRVSTCSQQCEVKASRWSGGAQICWGRVQMAAVPRGNERLRWPACRTAALGDAIFTTISSKHHGLTHAFPTQIPLDRIRSVEDPRPAPRPHAARRTGPRARRDGEDRKREGAFGNRGYNVQTAPQEEPQDTRAQTRSRCNLTRRGGGAPHRHRTSRVPPQSSTSIDPRARNCDTPRPGTHIPDGRLSAHLRDQPHTHSVARALGTPGASAIPVISRATRPRSCLHAHDDHLYDLG